MKKESIEYSIIPKKRAKHGFNVDTPLNKTFLDSKVAKRYTSLFKNRTPLEQFITFYLVNYKVVNFEIRKQIRDIFVSDDAFYIDEVFSKEKKDVVTRWKLGEIENKVYFTKKKIEKLTKHHIIPRSRRDLGFNVGSRSNHLSLTNNFHSRWHKVFSNKLPNSILLNMLDLNSQVLSEKVRKTFSEISALNFEDFYDNEILL